MAITGSNYRAAIAAGLECEIKRVLSRHMTVTSFPPWLGAQSHSNKAQAWRVVVLTDAEPLCYVFLYKDVVTLERLDPGPDDSLIQLNLEYANPALVDFILEFVRAAIRANCRYQPGYQMNR